MNKILLDESHNFFYSFHSLCSHLTLKEELIRGINDTNIINAFSMKSRIFILSIVDSMDSI